VSTLLSKRVEVGINCDLPFSVAVKLLQEHGKWICNLTINFFRIDGPTDPRLWMGMVINSLNLVPVLEYLGFGYEHDFVYGENVEEIGRIVGLEWNNLVPTPVSHFPPLKSHAELDVRLEMEDIQLTPPNNFFNPIFAAYGSQVSKVSYPPTLFYQIEGAMALNLHCCSLSELRLFGANHIAMWQNIGQLYLPHLRKLEIAGIEMEVVKIAPVLKRHSDSLEELHLGVFTSKEMKYSQIWIDVVFSKLKQLTLYAVDIRSFWRNWYLIQMASFPRLEKLKVIKNLEENEENLEIPKLGDPEFEELPMLKAVTLEVIGSY